MKNEITEKYLNMFIENNKEILLINKKILDSYKKLTKKEFKDFIEKESKKYNFIFNNEELENLTQTEYIEFQKENNINYQIIFSEKNKLDTIKKIIYFNNEEELEIQVSISITTCDNESEYNFSNLLLNIDNGGISISKCINFNKSFKDNNEKLDIEFIIYDNTFLVKYFMNFNGKQNTEHYTKLFNKNYDLIFDFVMNNKELTNEEKDIFLLNTDERIPNIKIEYKNLNLKKILENKIINENKKNIKLKNK